MLLKKKIVGREWIGSAAEDTEEHCAFSSEAEQRGKFMLVGRSTLSEEQIKVFKVQIENVKA
jgi:hypothetical protein